MPSAAPWPPDGDCVAGGLELGRHASVQSHPAARADVPVAGFAQQGVRDDDAPQRCVAVIAPAEQQAALRVGPKLAGLAGLVVGEERKAALVGAAREGFAK